MHIYEPKIRLIRTHLNSVHLFERVVENTRGIYRLTEAELAFTNLKV